ncbi:hypothetical protein OF83DRAFT_1088929 [Amylostereum chailletii]|nr:hypothetical protein OF83DRAFT_1088929 [Amylostereum chailletii]
MHHILMQSPSGVETHLAERYVDDLGETLPDVVFTFTDPGPPGWEMESGGGAVGAALPRRGGGDIRPSPLLLVEVEVDGVEDVGYGAGVAPKLTKADGKHAHILEGMSASGDSGESPYHFILYRGLDASEAVPFPGRNDVPRVIHEGFGASEVCSGTANPPVKDFDEDLEKLGALSVIAGHIGEDRRALGKKSASGQEDKTGKFIVGRAREARPNDLRPIDTRNLPPIFFPSSFHLSSPHSSSAHAPYSDAIPLPFVAEQGAETHLAERHVDDLGEPLLDVVFAFTDPGPPGWEMESGGGAVGAALPRRGGGDIRPSPLHLVEVEVDGVEDVGYGAGVAPKLTKADSEHAHILEGMSASGDSGESPYHFILYRGLDASEAVPFPGRNDAPRVIHEGFGASEVCGGTANPPVKDVDEDLEKLGALSVIADILVRIAGRSVRWGGLERGGLHRVDGNGHVREFGRDGCEWKEGGRKEGRKTMNAG